MTLQVDGLTCSYGPTIVLRDVSATVTPGSVTALFGPNGTGKSTLFRCILGLLPHDGKVIVDGRPTRRWSAKMMAHHVAFVPQDHRPTFPHSVRDIVTMGVAGRASAFFGPSARDISDALENLDRLGIVHLAEREFSSLSGGQRQLVLIARALTQSAAYLLFDEPTASLDFGNQNLIWHTIRELAHETGKGILVCSHDPNHVLWFCDHAVVLSRQGRTMSAGAVSDVITESTLHALYPGRPQLAAAHGAPIVIPRSAARR